MGVARIKNCGGGQKWTSEVDQLNISGFIYMVLKSKGIMWFKMSIFKKTAGSGPGLAGFPAVTCQPPRLPPAWVKYYKHRW